MDPASKLALDAFKNDKESHILIRQEICKSCAEKYCLYVCPGGLYSINEETGELLIEYAGCLECGSCRVACPYGALEWSYPRGGFGVQYRYG
ncbi:MAG: 4Fe-4S dicluster domain-containing protein [Deltaproteobacteria bacterium]|nr:4Fe-4S dicluster domain-containing protein [Deltaproteobacteria bacterium]